MRNCDSESNHSFYMPWMPTLKRCPWATIDPESIMAMKWHHEYSRLRVLPFGGSDLMAQPAYVYEAIQAVDRATLEIQHEHARKQREEDERAASDLEAKRRAEEAKGRH